MCQPRHSSQGEPDQDYVTQEVVCGIPGFTFNFKLLALNSRSKVPTRSGRPTLCYDRQRNVTGPSIGCTIAAPVRRDSIRLAFSAKYHFARRSASSISINRELCFTPSARWSIFSESLRRKVFPDIQRTKTGRKNKLHAATIFIWKGTPPT